jgi:2-phosphosulfolactate phosphatase
MIIQHLHLLQGASEARGLTVIIDVFRAFSLACYAYAQGASIIYPVQTVEEAKQMKIENPDFVLIGERHEKKCVGFDYGNSPTHIFNVDFSGKCIVHTTSSGTNGISLAKNASEIITGSFVNAKAIADYIKQNNPELVSLVGMGYEGKRITMEDYYCAQYIHTLIEGKDFDYKTVIEKLRVGDGARLLDPANHEHSPASDFDLCLDKDRFPFVLRVEKDRNGRNFLNKIDPFNK